MLIPLGYHCNISYLNQALYIKKETSVFEWFENTNLKYITDIITPTEKINETNCEAISHNSPSELRQKLILFINLKTMF